MDGSITQWINAAAGTSRPLDQIMIGITTFGLPVLIGLVVLQWWSKHDRPHVRHTAVVAGLSFLLGLGIVAAFALQALPGRAVVFGAMALAIGWSRVLVGTHYVTDVLGGAVTGFAAAILVGALYRKGSRLDRLVTSIL